MGKLDGKVAIITGGASGIGEATVRLFIRQGARVVIADILDDEGQELAKELGASTIYLHTNVAQEDDIKAMVDYAQEKFGRLDCLFNNAGIGGAGGLIDEVPMLGFDITVAILFRAVFMGMKYAAPVMKKQGEGSIISTASVAGHKTGFAGHTYSACKAAVIHLTRSVAVELGEFNIRVNCVCPGGIATPLFGRALGFSIEEAKQTVEPIQSIFKNVQAIKRSGLPEDIAKAVLWLASDDSSFVNGAALHVDGGIRGGMLDREDIRSPMMEVLGIEEV
ncbi:MAG: glucose 1-dehydrogenase [Deltaproteobacteria bacterium]|nr:glucose 1-dehydrogenase [Deltaproteobacteria bacterium]MBW2085781.1 glucose 1-dehydrogenase [Deltaproteobacteria bacterium]